MADNISGLTKREVRKSRSKYGNNNIVIDLAPNFLVRFIKAFFSLSQLSILAAIFLSCLEIYYLEENYYKLGILVGLYVLIGIIKMTYSSRMSIDYSKLMEYNTRVIRDGTTTSVFSDELVVGDIIQVSQNDRIMADGIILECRDLVINENIYNSKNRRVIKKAQDNVYLGSYVLFGNALIKVTAVGNDTVLASSNINQNIKLEYERKLRRLQQILLLAALLAGSGVIGYILYRTDGFHLNPVLHYVPMLIPFYFTLGVAGSILSNDYFLGKLEKQLSKKNIELYSEGVLSPLADLELVVLDKDESFTKDHKSIVQSFADDQEMIALGLGLYAKDHENDYSDAFKQFAADKHFDLDALKNKMPAVNTSANTSFEHVVSNLYKSEKGYILYSIGPVEELLDISTRIYMDGEDIFFGAKEREFIGKHSQLMKRQGEQVLGISYVIYRNEIGNVNYVNDLCFIGLIGLMYPLKEGVLEGIEVLKQLNVDVMMISDERPDIVAISAKKAGLIHSDQQVLTGSALEAMTQRRLAADLGDYKVFVNMNASQKNRLMKTLKEFYSCKVGTIADSVIDFRTITDADVLFGGKTTTSEFISSFSSVSLENVNLNTIADSISNARLILEKYTKMMQAAFTLFIASLLIASGNLLLTIRQSDYAFEIPVLYIAALFVSCFLTVNCIARYNSKKSIYFDFNKLVISSLFNGIAAAAIFFGCVYCNKFYQLLKLIPNGLFISLVLLVFFGSYLFENRKLNSYQFHLPLVICRILTLSSIGLIYYYDLKCTIVISNPYIVILFALPVVILICGMIFKKLLFHKECKAAKRKKASEKE